MLDKNLIREDVKIKSEIIESVIDKTSKDTLKDGKLFEELQKLTVAELLERYDAPSKHILKGKITLAFGREKEPVYLLGIDSSGVAYWLEAPTWDCSWYWGFGYVETYTSNLHPEKSRDIESHLHIDTSFIGAENADDGKYCHNLYDSHNFKYTTFSEQDGWTLSELFKRFYLLKDSAAMFEKGGAHVSGADDYLKQISWAEQINKELVPETTKRIIEILSK